MKISGQKSITSLKFLSQTPKEMISNLSQEIDPLIPFRMKDNFWKMWRELSLFWILISFRVKILFHTSHSTKKAQINQILKERSAQKVNKEIDCLRIQCYCYRAYRKIVIKIYIRVSTK